MATILGYKGKVADTVYPVGHIVHMQDKMLELFIKSHADTCGSEWKLLEPTYEGFSSAVRVR